MFLAQHSVIHKGGPPVKGSLYGQAGGGEGPRKTGISALAQPEAPLPTGTQRSCLLGPAFPVLCHLSLASREHPNGTSMEAHLGGAGPVHTWRAQHLC